MPPGLMGVDLFLVSFMVLVVCVLLRSAKPWKIRRKLNSADAAEGWGGSPTRALGLVPAVAGCHGVSHLRLERRRIRWDLKLLPHDPARSLLSQAAKITSVESMTSGKITVRSRPQAWGGRHGGKPRPNKD